VAQEPPQPEKPFIFHSKRVYNQQK